MDCSSGIGLRGVPKPSAAQDVKAEATDQANSYATAISASRFAAKILRKTEPDRTQRDLAVSRALEAVADALEHMGGEDATS